MSVTPRQRSLETCVWLIDLRAATPSLLAIEAETPRLSQTEVTRAAAMSDATAAASWRAARVALRLVLERFAGAGLRGVAFDISASGKPGLPDEALVFSLSHAAGHAVVAISMDGPLGVDLEGMRSLRMADDRRLAIEQAGALLCQQALPDDGASRFLQAWVRLEALAKAEGEGLAKVLARAGAFGPRRGRGQAGNLKPPHVAVCDLAIGAGLFGAIALPVGSTGVIVGTMPTDQDGLRAFAAI